MYQYISLLYSYVCVKVYYSVYEDKYELRCYEGYIILSN